MSKTSVSVCLGKSHNEDHDPLEKPKSHISEKPMYIVYQAWELGWERL